MKEDFEDHHELVGKVIRQFRIFRDSREGVECEIDFDDGTRFNFTVEHHPHIETSISQTEARTQADVKTPTSL